jgi:hypothetical protein
MKLCVTAFMFYETRVLLEASYLHVSRYNYSLSVFYTNYSVSPKWSKLKHFLDQEFHTDRKRII